MVSSPISLTPTDLALAAALVLANGAVSLSLDLGLGRRLIVASARTILQLTLLGLVLDWVLRSNDVRIVTAVLVAMAILAGVEAVRRTTRRVRGIYAGTTLVVLTSSLLVATYSLGVVIDVEPWWSPRYSLPILGMILGNALNGVSLGLETALDGFARERAAVEVLLAHGATRREASRDVVRKAVRTGTIPILNSMTAAGLISIPGMMTGQILSGESPLDAARYQIAILFAIAGAVALGTIGVVFLARRLVFDERDRLRVERISSTGERG